MNEKILSVEAGQEMVDEIRGLRARVVELEAAIGRKDQAANVMANLTDKVQDHNEVLERERDAANQRADSNYAAFEQEQKNLEECRQRVATAEAALEIEKQISTSFEAERESVLAPLPENATCKFPETQDSLPDNIKDLLLERDTLREHRRKMLDALPPQLAKQMNADIVMGHYFEPDGEECEALNRYEYAAIRARDAQASLSDAEAPKP